jgi:hypothetical protein
MLEAVPTNLGGEPVRGYARLGIPVVTAGGATGGREEM